MTSRTRVALLAGALLLPLTVTGIWYALGTQSDNDGNSGGIIGELGYLELVPPSRLFGPGTIATVEKLPNGSLQLHPTCTMDKEVLTALWAESATANRDSVWSVKDTLKATAEAANMVTSSAAGKQIKQISVSLQNMRVITMSHEDLINVRDKYLKGTCEEAVVLNLQSGAVVCQTAEVLQADMAYRMQFADGLESMQKVALAKQAAASLDLTVDESRTDVMRGEELYYGVRLRQTSCLSLADNTDRFAAASHRTGDAVW